MLALHCWLVAPRDKILAQNGRFQAPGGEVELQAPHDKILVPPDPELLLRSARNCPNMLSGGLGVRLSA